MYKNITEMYRIYSKFYSKRLEYSELSLFIFWIFHSLEFIAHFLTRQRTYLSRSVHKWSDISSSDTASQLTRR